MAKVTYVDAGGLATTIDVAEGWSLMQAAVTNGVQGIVGECGGSCACATCHCYVDEARLAELPGPDDNELAMLDFAAADVRANSRLSCQIKASSRLLKKSDSGAKFVNKPDSKRVPPGIKIEPKCVFQQPVRALETAFDRLTASASSRTQAYAARYSRACADANSSPSMIWIKAQLPFPCGPSTSISSAALCSAISARVMNRQSVAPSGTSPSFHAATSAFASISSRTSDNGSEVNPSRTFTISRLVESDLT